MAMLRFIGLLPILIFSNLAGAQAPLDFLATLKMAMEKSPALSSVKIDQTVRELESKNAFSLMLPSLDLSTSAGYVDSRPKLNDRLWSSEFNLSLSENLYDNGLSLMTYNSSKIRKEIADLTFKNERDRLLLEVAIEYLRYSRSKSLYETQKRQFEIVNKQYKSVESQFRQGVRTRRDYLKFKTEVRRTEIQVQNSFTATEQSRVELMRLIGFDQKDVRPFEFTPVEIKTETVAQVPQESPNIGGHPLYRIAELQKNVLENDVKIVTRRYWPQLFATAGANYHRGDYLGLEVAPAQADITSWNALLNLKFNIWDWGIRRRDISIAEAKRTQAENTLAVQLNSFSSDNSKLMLDLQQSAKNFSLATELLDLEQRSYDFMNTDYRNGKLSYLDVVVGLRDLLNAEVEMTTSYYDLRQQLLRYRYFEGRLYESLFEN